MKTADGKVLANGDMAYLSKDGSNIVISADGAAKVLIMAGQPLDEPIAQYGPFVMNTHEEIMQAFKDLKA